MPQLPSAMTAIEIERPGGPEVLRAVERPVPEPGPGEVLVQVEAAGVNRPDLMQRLGKYPPPPGRVGHPGSRDRRDDRVRRGRREPMACRRSDLRARRGRRLRRVLCRSGDPVPADPGRPGRHRRGSDPGNVLHGVDQRLRARPAGRGGAPARPRGRQRHRHDRRFSSRARSARSCSRRQAPTTSARRAARSAPPSRSTTARRTSSRWSGAETSAAGVDVILDIVGGDYFARNIECLAMHGRLVQIGLMGGPKAELNLRAVLHRRLTITGSTLRARSVAEKGALAREVETHVWPLLAAGRVAPVIDRVFPLERGRRGPPASRVGRARRQDRARRSLGDRCSRRDVR